MSASSSLRSSGKGRQRDIAAQGPTAQSGSRSVDARSRYPNRLSVRCLQIRVSEGGAWVCEKGMVWLAERWVFVSACVSMCSWLCSLCALQSVIRSECEFESQCCLIGRNITCPLHYTPPQSKACHVKTHTSRIPFPLHDMLIYHATLTCT